MTLMSDSDWVDATIVAAVFRADYHIALLAILGALLLLSALLLALFARDPKRRYQPQNLWVLSSGFSILCVLAVLAIWVLLSIAAFPQGSGSPVLSQQDVDRYLAAQPTVPAEQPRILIPTGVFVQTIEFTTAFDPIVSGVIWQRYGPDVPADVARGFTLPDGSDLQSAEAYRTTQGDTQVIGCSIDSKFTHSAWLNTPKSQGGIEGVKYALLSDLQGKIASAYGILADAGVAYRALFLIDKQGIVRHQVVNDLPLGRNVEEAIRLLDALQHFEAHGEVCPANWSKGKEAMKPTKAGVTLYLQK